ncbi:MAG: TetR family transcriptional regulator [Pirellulaceae bacterium]|nr:MAG: TetR family transcriptional regulator [Pirellulaceae bacterium]
MLHFEGDTGDHASEDPWKAVASGKLAEIYRSAAEIFVQKGFDATSMNEIAAAVDLTKAGLYHYVRGKHELLFAIMQFAMDVVDQKIVIPAQAIEDPEERLRFILDRHAGLTRYLKEISILTDEVVALKPEHRQIVLERKRRYFEFVRETLRQLQHQKKLQQLDVTVATLNLLATLLGIARWYRADGRLSAEEIARQTRELLLHGLLRCEQSAIPRKS